MVTAKRRARRRFRRHRRSVVVTQDAVDQFDPNRGTGKGRRRRVA
jgi:hypothetical protein